MRAGRNDSLEGRTIAADSEGIHRRRAKNGIRAQDRRRITDRATARPSGGAPGGRVLWLQGFPVAVPGRGAGCAAPAVAERGLEPCQTMSLWSSHSIQSAVRTPAVAPGGAQARN